MLACSFLILLGTAIRCITLEPVAATWYAILTVKSVLNDHMKQDLCLAFQTGGCLLLHESSVQSSCRRFLCHFHSAVGNYLSIAISMSPEWIVA